MRTQVNPRLLESTQHRLDVRNVTRVRVYGPDLPSASPAVTALRERGLVEFAASNANLLELEFDGRREAMLDSRPVLPLVIYH